VNHFMYKDTSNARVTTSWEAAQETSVNPQPGVSTENMHRLLSDLTQAVLDFGPNKSHHMKVLVRHRTEWPHLWEQIDSIVSFIASSNEGENNE
jgi:hypothetical protein